MTAAELKEGMVIRKKSILRGEAVVEGYPSHLSAGAPMIEIEAVRMEFPSDANIIVGQSHFIKTVEDLYEAMSTTVPQDLTRLSPLNSR